VTVEPRVEDLLATIRKAIDDDLSGLDAAATTSGNSTGKILRGALREMRVNYDGNGPDPQQADREIAELRDRINRSRSSSFPTVSTAPTPPPPRVIPRQASKPGGVGSILGGSQSRAPSQYSAAVPPLRLGYDEFGAERETTDYKPAYQENAWPEDHPQQADYYPAQPVYEPQVTPPLISQRTAQQAQNSFQQLAESLMARATGDRGIEDMTRDLLRGLLKQWLDDNLPQLVEQLVREEIERVARRGR
jgi:cell pole-organizing protein PopZ